MAFTLSDLLQAGYFGLGQLNVYVATGGSTTTIVDTNTKTGKDNTWKDGAAFVIRDAGGLNAAPEGQFARVSAYVASTGTYTLDATLTSAVASGDTYGVVSQEYPLAQMIQAANQALRLMGDLDLVDTTTLDTAAATTEYAASATWKRTRPFRVDVQGRTGASADNQWQEWPDWEYVPATAGAAGKLIFPEYPTASRDIRVWYRGPHPYVNAYNDPIAEVLDPETAVAAFQAKALDWANSRARGADEFMLQRGQKAEQQLLNLQVARPRVGVKRKPKLLIIGPNTTPDDQFDYPDPA